MKKEYKTDNRVEYHIKIGLWKMIHILQEANMLPYNLIATDGQMRVGDNCNEFEIQVVFDTIIQSGKECAKRP